MHLHCAPVYLVVSPVGRGRYPACIFRNGRGVCARKRSPCSCWRVVVPSHHGRLPSHTGSRDHVTWQTGFSSSPRSCALLSALPSTASLAAIGCSRHVSRSSRDSVMPPICRTDGVAYRGRACSSDGRAPASFGLRTEQTTVCASNLPSHRQVGLDNVQQMPQLLGSSDHWLYLCSI